MVRMREIPWRRISAEMAAIVVSILLAFWIQAWWEARQQRIDEQRVLQSLSVEFGRLRDEAAELRVLYSAVLDSLVTLIEIGKGTSAEPEPAELDRMFVDTVWYETLGEWTSADLDTLVGSGDLALISNRELRWEIARWPSKLRQLQDLIQQDRYVLFNRYLPYLSANADVPGLSTMSASVPGSPNERFEFPVEINVPVSESHRALLDRREFVNLLWERLGQITDVFYLGLGYPDPDQQSRGNIARDLEATIEMIEQELRTF